jgi:DNA-directed RNA polymerase subunit omega
MLISPVEVRRDTGINKYALTVAVAKRAREINSGKEPIIKTSATKPVTIALDEIIKGEVEIIQAQPEK